MTNNEILKADILDIIFEKRNKDYGAYAIRRGYDRRLLAALGAAMTVVFVLLLVLTSARKNNSLSTTERKKNVVELREFIVPPEKSKEPEPPKEQPKAKVQPRVVQKVATKKFTSKIEIKPDNKVKESMPDVTDTGNKVISDTEEKGKPDDGIPKKKEETVVPGNGNTSGNTDPVVIFKPQETNPEFPGGPEALKRFLAGNLRTPSDLEDGEKKTVLIRFRVDKDGSVNTFEIVTSGGGEFDQEVVRVCKRMPRWTPAFQNGINVPVSYMLPVTFIGAEQ